MTMNHHQCLLDKLDLQSGQSVCDLGCGRGSFFTEILEKIGENGTVLGLDSDQPSLDQIAHTHENFIRAQRAKTLHHDLSNTLPLKSQSFDRVLCHNVLECLNPERYVPIINEVCDLLQDGGVFVLSHMDFASALYNHSDIKLTRKLIHHFADTKQDWQQYHDGQIGRKLSGIAKQSCFKNMTAFAFLIDEIAYAPKTYGYQMSEWIVSIANQSKSFAASDLKKWKDELANFSKKDQYFFSIQVMGVILKK
jgi:ubiquinone/menaquinone biosynthesis C-methylase UbiE